MTEESYDHDKECEAFEDQMRKDLISNGTRMRRLENAVKLILAIAQFPLSCPDETVKLAPMTSKQLRDALKED